MNNQEPTPKDQLEELIINHLVDSTVEMYNNLPDKRAMEQLNAKAFNEVTPIGKVVEEVEADWFDMLRRTPYRRLDLKNEARRYE